MIRKDIGNMSAINRLIKYAGSLVLLGASVCAQAALTVTPATWNIIGLDSNSPAAGPRYFPVGVRVCSDSTATNVTASFNWTSSNAYINLRSGSPSSLTIPSIPAGECRNAIFEVEVTRTAAAFDTARRYYISVNGLSSPTPRELYVEYLISQNRNAVSDIKLDGASVPFGGAMNLFVGSTYTISLIGSTATQGYEQLEAFINLPHTIFRINSISTSFSADTSNNIYSPGYPYLYLDGCTWENDPNSPNYMACLGTGKGGGNVRVDYNVTILGGGGTSQGVNSLLYDFSGSSFHYNADFSLAGFTVNVIDPTAATIAKSFLPSTIAPNGTSTLTLTLGNPTAGTITGTSITDAFPSGMTVASPLTYSTTCGGSYSITDASGGSLGVGDSGIKISGASIPAGSSCTLKVAVTSSSNGSYVNTTQNLFVNDGTDTGKTATATLTVDSSSFPPPTAPSSCPGSEVTLASWTFSGSYSSSYTADSKNANVSSAVATSSGVTTPTINATSGRWVGTDGWTTSTTGITANMAHVQFAVDTSKFNGVRIQYGHLISGTGDWGSSNSIYTYSSSDGTSYSQIDSRATTKGATSGTLTTVGPVAASATGTGTTYFRLVATGAADSATKDPALELDNVTITGCAAPAPSTPPSISKAFSPATIAAGTTSTLTFTLSNPGASSLTGIKFTDTLPSGVVVAATPSASTTCGGSPTWSPTAGSSLLSFGQTTGTTLAAGASCTVSVKVTAASAGSYDNVSGAVFANESGSNTTSTGIASATLIAVAPPVIAKQFGTDPISSGGTSTLLFTLTNPNASYAMSGVAFSDSLPSGMTVASVPAATTSNCGSPTFSPVAGASSITFSGGSIAAGGTCSVSLKVTATTGGTSTTYTNTSGNVSHTINSATANGNTASDTLTVNPVNPSLSLLKQVATSSGGTWKSYEAVTTGSSVYYRFLVENTGDVPLSSVSVSDPASYISMAGCAWQDGDGNSLSSPFSLPVAGASNAHYAICVLGPVTATSGTHTNTATAQGTYSGTTVSETSSATYATISLTLDKTSGQSLFKTSGETLTYNYLVSNTGAATLGTIGVADDKTTVSCPSLTTAKKIADNTLGDGDNFLDSGEYVICTASYSVTASDVSAKTLTNTATATATNPSATSNTDSVTLPLAADLGVIKTNDVSGSVSLSASSVSFVWTLTVTNSASAGTATFANNQTILSDSLPTTGPTYSLGTVTTAGATGTVSCTITSNTLTCKASGGSVTLLPGLSGTVTVSNGSTTVTGSGTSFTTQVSAGSKLVIAGVTYTVASVSSNTELTLTTAYGGSNASGLSLPSTISVPITVTATAGGVLANPASGGVCQADPNDVLDEINDTNNNCSDSVTVTTGAYSFSKTVQTLSDPINGTSNPKTIPGAVVEYTLTFINATTGTVDNNSIVLSDSVPANMKMKVAPVTFNCSTTPPCGLTYSDSTDISYSNNNGSTFVYTPVPDADGYDALVTDFRLSPKGTMGASTPPNTSSFNFKIQMQIK